MPNFKPHKINFVRAKDGTPIFFSDLPRIFGLAKSRVVQLSQLELDRLLQAIEQRGVQSIHAHPVSPKNNSWFVFFDITQDSTIALYAFVDKYETIHIYHANRQTTPSVELSLLADGMRFAKNLSYPIEDT
jgi:hypothetical protein